MKSTRISKPAGRSVSFQPDDATEPAGDQHHDGALAVGMAVMGDIVEKEATAHAAMPSFETSFKLSAAAESGFPQSFHRENTVISSTNGSTSLFKQRLLKAQQSRVSGERSSFGDSSIPQSRSGSAASAGNPKSWSMSGMADDDSSATVARMSSAERNSALEEVSSLLSDDTIQKWLRMRQESASSDTAAVTSPSSSSSPRPTQPAPASASSSSRLLDLSSITTEEQLQAAVNTMLPDSEKQKLAWTGMVGQMNDSRDDNGEFEDEAHLVASRVDFTGQQSPDELPDGGGGQLPSASSSSSSGYGVGTAQLFAAWAQAMEGEAARDAALSQAEAREVVQGGAGRGSSVGVTGGPDPASASSQATAADILSTDTIGRHLADMKRSLGLGTGIGEGGDASKSVRLAAHPSLLRLRFDLRGYLVRQGYSGNNDGDDDGSGDGSPPEPHAHEDITSLYHHGASFLPGRAGYTLVDLLGLARSSVTGQREASWRAVGGVLARRRAAFMGGQSCPGQCCAAGNVPQQQCVHASWQYQPSQWQEEAALLRTLLLPPILPLLLRAGIDETRVECLAPALAALAAWATADADGSYHTHNLHHSYFGVEDVILHPPSLRPQPPCEDEDDWARALARLEKSMDDGDGDGDEAANNGSGSGGGGMSRSSRRTLMDGRAALVDPIRVLCTKMGLLHRLCAVMSWVASLPQAAVTTVHVSVLRSCVALLTSIAHRDLSLADEVGRRITITARPPSSRPGSTAKEVGALPWLVAAFVSPLAGGSGVSKVPKDRLRLALQVVILVRIVCQQGRGLAASLCDEVPGLALNDDGIPVPSKAAEQGHDVPVPGAGLGIAASSLGVSPLVIDSLLHLLPLTESSRDAVMAGAWSTSTRGALALETMRLMRVCLTYGCATDRMWVLWQRLRPWIPAGISAAGDRIVVDGRPQHSLPVAFACGVINCVAATISAAVRDLAALSNGPHTQQQEEDAVALAREAHTMLLAVLHDTRALNETFVREKRTDSHTHHAQAIECAMLHAIEVYLAAPRCNVTLQFVDASGESSSSTGAAEGGLELPSLLLLATGVASVAATATDVMLTRYVCPLIEAVGAMQGGPPSPGSASLLLSWSRLTSLVLHVAPNCSSRVADDAAFQTMLLGSVSQLLDWATSVPATPFKIPAEVAMLASSSSPSRLLCHAAFAAINVLMMVDAVPSASVQGFAVRLLALLPPGDEGMAWSLLVDVILQVSSGAKNAATSPDVTAVQDLLQQRRSLMPLWRDAVMGAGNPLVSRAVTASIINTACVWPGLLPQAKELLQSCAADSPILVAEAIPMPAERLPDSTRSGPSSLATRPPFRLMLPSSASSSQGGLSALSALLALLPEPLRTLLGMPLQPQALVSVPLAMGLALSGALDVLLGPAAVGQLQSVRGDMGGHAAGWLALAERAITFLSQRPAVMSTPGHYGPVADMLAQARTIHLLLHAALAPLSSQASSCCASLLTTAAIKFTALSSSVMPSQRRSLLSVLCRYPGAGGGDGISSLACALVHHLAGEGVGHHTAAAQAGVCILLMQGTDAAPSSSSVPASDDDATSDAAEVDRVVLSVWRALAPVSEGGGNAARMLASISIPRPTFGGLVAGELNENLSIGAESASTMDHVAAFALLADVNCAAAVADADHAPAAEVSRRLSLLKSARLLDGSDGEHDAEQWLAAASSPGSSPSASCAPGVPLHGFALRSLASYLWSGPSPSSPTLSFERVQLLRRSLQLAGLTSMTMSPANRGTGPSTIVKLVTARMNIKG